MPRFSPAHWHWIAPDAHRDGAGAFWTSESLRTAVKTGKAVTLSIGDLVMLSGDLVGEFAEFANVASTKWRHGPVNVAKGTAMSEPFAMCGARLLQFKHTGLARRNDLSLLRRNMIDYDGLKKEITAQHQGMEGLPCGYRFPRQGARALWCHRAVGALRVVRKEVVSVDVIKRVTPSLKDSDHRALRNAVRAGGYSDERWHKFDSDLFQFIVSDGYYAELGLDNAVHFSPDNWVRVRDFPHGGAAEDRGSSACTSGLD